MLYGRNGLRELASGVLFLACASALGDDAVNPTAEPSGEPQEPPTLTIEVSAKRNTVENAAQPSQTEVTHEQISRTPRGDQISLPQLLESTSPSVISGGYGRIYTRQDENGLQYQLDGMELPDLPDNALGDFVDPRDIAKMEVTLGALPAEFGDRPSGVINIITPQGREETSSSVELNYGTYNAWSPQAELRGGTSGGGFRYFISANYHQTDRGLDTPQPVSITDEGQGTSDAVHDFAHGNSEFGRLDFTLTSQDLVTVLLFNREELYQIPNFPASYLPSDPLFSQGDIYGNDPYDYTPPNTDDSQNETSLFAEAAWKHSFSDKEFLQLGIFYRYFKILVQNDPANDLAALLNPSLTGNPDPGNASLYESRHTNSAGLKLDYKLIASDAHTLKAGANLKAYQTVGIASVEGANPFSSGPSILSSADTSPEYGFVAGFYVQDEWKMSESWFLNVGLRYDDMHANYSDANPSFDQVEPRVLLSYLATPSTKVHAFYGRLFNVPLFEDLHDTFSALANQAGQTIAPYDIKPETDNYYELGVDQQFGEGHVVSVTGFYKQATNLLDDAQLLNTALQQPFNWANGYAYGIELATHGKLAEHLSGYLNYSYGMAKGSGISGGLFAIPEPPSDGYQILDHVQQHTASAGLTYANGHAWATVVERFGSGLPTGPDNSENAPSHFSTDATIGYEFHSKDWADHLKLSFDALNIFDNRYAIFIANGFNGSYYAPGLEFIGHLSKEFE